MHYFGSFALYLPWLVLADVHRRRAGAAAARWSCWCASLALLHGVLACPVRHQLLRRPVLAGDANFRSLRPILGDLRKACAKEPGIVLADNDAGHYIRYYTECSVIANNFLLTPQHEEKIRQMDYLTSLPALRCRVPRRSSATCCCGPSASCDRGQARYMSYSQGGAAHQDLLLKPLDQVPSNYVLIEQANMRAVEGAGSVPYIRLFKVPPRRDPPGPHAVAETRRRLTIAVTSGQRTSEQPHRGRRSDASPVSKS